VLRRSEVTAAIVGARRPDQIEGIAPAGDLQLSPEVLAEIDGLLGECQEVLVEMV
jgi:aryl-alcohol dehydrogenase-like predicted oxidoreductase